MPEHVHLLIRPRLPDYATKTILANIKRPVGQKAVAWLRQNRPEFLDRLTIHNRNRTYHRFWQAGPGQDHNVYDPAAVHEIIEYIHNNPVRRGLVTRAEQWLWSSASDWATYEDVVLKIDRTVPTIAKFES